MSPPPAPLPPMDDEYFEVSFGVSIPGLTPVQVPSTSIFMRYYQELVAVQADVAWYHVLPINIEVDDVDGLTVSVSCVYLIDNNDPSSTLSPFNFVNYLTDVQEGEASLDLLFTVTPSNSQEFGKILYYSLEIDILGTHLSLGKYMSTDTLVV